MAERTTPDGPTEEEVASLTRALDAAYDRIAGPGETYTAEDMARALLEAPHPFRDALERSEAARANLEATRAGALSDLEVAQGADRDILNGRPWADAAEEHSQAIDAAIQRLRRAGDPVVLREHDAKVLRDAAGLIRHKQHAESVRQMLNARADALGKGGDSDARRPAAE